MPGKKYRVYIPGDSKPYDWDEEKFERNKEKLFTDHSDAQVVEVNDTPDLDNIKTGGAYNVYIPGDENSYVWGGDKLSRNRDKLLNDHPDTVIEQYSPVKWSNGKVYTESSVASAKARLDEFNAANGEFMSGFEAQESAAAKQAGMSTVGGSLINPARDYVNENREAYLALKRQRDSILDDYYNNPFIREEIEGKAKTASELHDLFRENIKGAERATERRAWRRAAKMMDDARKLYEAPNKYIKDVDEENGFTKFFKSYGRGIKDVGSDADFWSMGLTEVSRNFDLRGIQKKLEAVAAEKGESLTDADIDAVLSPSEKAELQAWTALSSAQAERAGSLSGAYQAGQGSAESLMFMAQFLLSSGLGNLAGKGLAQSSNAIASYLGRSLMTDQALSRMLQYGRGVIPSGARLAKTGKYLEQGAKILEGAERFETAVANAGKVGGKAITFSDRVIARPIIQGAWHTLTQPAANIQNISQKALETHGGDSVVPGNPGEGQLVGIGRALWKGILDSFIENWSESIGGALDLNLAKSAENWKGNFGRISRWLWESPVTEVAVSAGFNGLAGEMAEEWIGNAARIPFGLMSKEEFGRFGGNIFSKDADKRKEAIESQLEMAASFGPLSIIGLGGAARGARAKSKEFKTQADKVRDVLGRYGVSDEGIKNVFDVKLDSSKEIAQKLSQYGESIYRGAQSDEQKAKDYQELLKLADLIGQRQVLKNLEDYQRDDDRVKMRQSISAGAGTFWQTHESEAKDRKTGEPIAINQVRVLTYADGHHVYITGSDEEGRLAGVNEETGKKVYLTEDGISADADILSDREVMLDDYLDERVAEMRSSEEAQRMEDERRQQIEDVKRRAMETKTVQMGTAEAPVVADIVATSSDGVMVRYNDNEEFLSWASVAEKMGTPISVKTDAEIEADLAEMNDKADERVEKYKGIVAGTQMTARVDLGDGQYEETTFRYDSCANEDGIVIFFGKDENDVSVKFAEDSIVDLDKAVNDSGVNLDEAPKVGDRVTYTAEDGSSVKGVLSVADDGSGKVVVRRDDNVDAVVKADDIRADESPATDENPDVPKDFNGNPIPLKDNGDVDQKAFWNDNPEGWAKWNDEKRKDGGKNSAAYVQTALRSITSDRAKKQKQYDSETDFDKRDALEQDLAGMDERISVLNALADNYARRAEETAEEQAPVEETPAESPAEAPAEAAPVAEEKPTADAEIPLHEQAGFESKEALEASIDEEAAASQTPLTADEEVARVEAMADEIYNGQDNERETEHDVHPDAEGVPQVPGTGREVAEAGVAESAREGEGIRGSDRIADEGGNTADLRAEGNAVSGNAVPVDNVQGNDALSAERESAAEPGGLAGAEGARVVDEAAGVQGAEQNAPAEAGAEGGVEVSDDVRTQYSKQEQRDRQDEAIGVVTGRTKEQVKTERQKRRIRKRADKWRKLLGDTFQILESEEDIDRSDMSDAKKAEMKQAVSGDAKAAGWYFTGTGKAYLYLPNIKSEGEVDMKVLHEVLSHKGLRGLLGDKAFDAVCDSVWEQMSEQNRAWALGYVNGKASSVSDRRAAADEYIAHVVEEREELKQNEGTWKKIVARVKEILNDMLGEDRFSVSDRNEDDIDRLIQSAMAMYIKQKNESSKRLSDKGAASSRDEARFSVRYIPRTDAERDEIIHDLMETTGVERERAERWLQSELSLASIILSEDNSQYLNYEADKRFKAIKDNSDYPQGTVDFNNICRKRLPFTYMYQQIQKQFPYTIITGEDLATIRNIMRDHDLMVACGLCYVEDRRQLLGEVAKEFIDGIADGFKSYSKKPGADTQKKGKPTNKQKKAKEFIELIGEDKKDDLSIYDLITVDGSAKLAEEHPGIYAAFQAFNSARGQGAQNLFQGYAEYKREILSWSEADVKKVNDLGGLRIFSYSDFEAHHLIDIVQIVQDCAAKGVKIQGYTKVPAFARAIANTNIKINRSLIPLGDTGMVDGKLAYDPVEGIDVNDPDFLESNDNVGNILIGINDEQIRLAMADPFIHFIIPYHTRQAKALRVMKQTGAWTNYVSSQNEKNISDGKVAKKNINIYTDVLNAAEKEGHPITNEREFTERFLSVAKERGLVPRFAQFLNTDADGNYVFTPGYAKFLVDFKMFDENGNILEQKPVVAEFDDEFNKKILDDYVAGEEAKLGENYDSVYEEIVDKLGLKTRTADIVKERLGLPVEGETRLSKKTDNEYLDAVAGGNIELAQKMVREAFAKKFPKTKVLDQFGRPAIVYHGGYFGYKDNGIEGMNPYVWDDNNGWFTESRRYAESYASEHEPIPAFLNITRTFDMGDTMDYLIEDGKPTKIASDYAERLGVSVDDIIGLIQEDYADSMVNDPKGLTARAFTINRNPKFAELLRKNGFDGATDLEADGVLAYMTTSPSQIKSAEPVTYDDNGNVIPLSERFSEEKDDIRFSFAGVTGALTLDKANLESVRMDNLDTARAMEETGSTPKEIKMATGWERAKDGKWRYEIGDAKIKDGVFGIINSTKRAGIRPVLLDILEPESEVLQAYPQLKYVIVTANTIKGEYGSANRGAKTINLSKGEIEKSGDPVKILKQTINHEIQHFIQGYEGFAVGGSSSVNPKNSESLAKAQAENPTLYNFLYYFGNAPASKLVRVGASNLRSQLSAHVTRYNIVGESLDRAKQIARELAHMDSYELGKLVRESKALLKKAKKEANDNYKRLAGEVEARNVGVRMPLNAEQRRQLTAEETEDVAREEQAVRFSKVTDRDLIARLDSEPKIRVYRSAQFIPDPNGNVDFDLGDGKGLQKGFLYAPMSAKVDGRWRDPISIGEWEQADENPELANDNGEFVLDKGNGDKLTVAYAPYLHTRRSPLNEQFSGAYERGNLVILESEIPESELTSGYTAEKSKKSTGEHDWPSGKVSNALAKEGMDTRKVILSRWAKPIRVVPNSEVADMISGLIGDRKLSFPYNVVTPGLRRELQSRGVKFSGWQGNKPKNVNEIIAGIKEESGEEVRFSKKAAREILDNYTDQNGEDKPWMSEEDVISQIEERLPYGANTEKLYSLIDRYRRLQEEDFNEGKRDFSGGEADDVFNQILDELESMSGEEVRFSKEDNDKLFGLAKERFGTTRDIREAGYVLPDGTMLDFSGRHWVSGGDTSYLNGDRQVDLRDIADLEFEKDGNTPTGIETSMEDFISRGAIRIDAKSGLINLSVKPTKAQTDVLRNLIRRNRNNVWVEFGDGNRSNGYAEYNYANEERVLGDINDYFDYGIRPEGDNAVRFSKANNNQRVFISNAEAALDGIQMEKATPEQWLKMLEGKGGLKAGEDKWIGLSDWIREQDRKTITKQDIADYIAQNQIQIEEVDYADNVDVESEMKEDIKERIGNGKSLDELQGEIDRLIASDEYRRLSDDYEKDTWLLNQMKSRYGDDFEVGYYIDEMQKVDYNIDPDALDEFGRYKSGEREINSIRKGYTTQGLDKKREIALTVPTIDPYNESDKIHFGDAGEGRAVAWIRFGETTTENETVSEKRAEYEKARKELDDHKDSLKRKYADSDKPFYEACTQQELERLASLKDTERALYKELESARRSPRRVLVIDEIQSKRHQDAREEGYRDDKAIEPAKKKVESAKKEYDDYIDSLKEKYDGYNGMAGNLTEEENKRAEELNDAVIAAQNEEAKSMDGIPSAPFEKNWHELAMKRMLRLAAEEGYDYVAWTTGEQQAERYNISKVVEEIECIRVGQNGNKQFSLKGLDHTILVSPEGIITAGEQEFKGKPLSDVVGKEIAVKMMAASEGDVLAEKDLKVGGEGMKGFYDQILPRFMDKYGKKWGVKTEDISLPNLEESAQTMHAVPVTEAMKESVMEGQVMFSKLSPVSDALNSSGISLGNPDVMKEYHLSALDLSKHGDVVTLSRIVAEKPGEGEGSRFMEDLAGLADQNGWTLALTPDDSFGATSVSRLKKFYKRFGFKENKGRSTDYSINESMIRRPAGDNGENALTRQKANAEAVASVDRDGIAGLVGAENELDFYKGIVDALPAELRSGIMDIARQNGFDIKAAAKEYIAAKAGMGFENDPTGELRLFSDILRYYSENGELLDDATARYALWKSGQEGGIMTDLASAANKQRWGVGKENEVRFSKGDLSRDIASTRTDISDVADDADAGLKLAKEIAKKTAATGSLLSVTRAMAGQRAYDKQTVELLTKAARQLLKEQEIDKMSRAEVARLLGIVNAANGKSPAAVKKYGDALVDAIVKHLVRTEGQLLGDLLKVKAGKVNASGVEVQGVLDVHGQNILKAMKAGMMMKYAEPGQEVKEKDGTIQGAILALDERLNSADEAVRKDADDKYEGYMLAEEYLRNIRESQLEAESLDEDLEEMEAKHNAGQMSDRDFREYKASNADAKRENQIELIESYRTLREKMIQLISGSKNAAREFREREQERKDAIRHFANSDLQGKDASTHRQEGRVDRLANSAVARFLAAPLATFDQMLRLFGEKSVDGKGYLWNYFMGKWNEATSNAYTGQRDAKDELDKKVSEVFGRDMIWSDLYQVERGMPKATVKWWDGGEMKEHELTQGNLLYIVMVDKMADGRMKLRRMGISEEDVKAIERQLDPRFLELAKWVQEDFLAGKRNKYNAIHERLFGASMAAIDNYFPLRINKRGLHVEEDISKADQSGQMNSTTTGAIVKRKRNSNELDLLNTDAFSVVIEHVDEMEQWAAFAEFNKDINTLLSDKGFRNKVTNMASVYGAGQKLWDSFKKVCQIAGNQYKPKVGEIDKAAVNIAKGFTAAKISFRVYTALKQFLSFPAFLTDANPAYLAKSVATPWKSWEWAMENLPIFEKRWKSRIAGDTRLMNTESDWKLFHNQMVEKLAKWGMSPNAFVDAVTVSIGAKAIYDTKYNRYIKEGYTEEQADKKAKQDATVLYNETQQSSESAFTSAIQVERTALATALSVFRNSSMGYQRQLHDALRNIGKYLKKGYREESIEFMTKQMVREGIPEDQARANAEKRYNREKWRSFARVANFGFVVQFAWNLGSSIAYLLFGDDDDEKDKMLKEAALKALYGGWGEGLAGGNVISEYLNKKFVTKENLYSFSPSLMPVVSDMKNLLQKMSSDQFEAWNDVFFLGTQALTGVNPQTFTDTIAAIVDACSGDLDTSKEVMILIMRILQVPQSQIDKIYIDELGIGADEAKKLPYEEIAERYAKYKVNREAPLRMVIPDDAKEEQIGKKKKTFKKKVTEREKLHNPKEE